MHNKTNSGDSIALLIDADNAIPKQIHQAISELAKHGIINIRKAYGNWAKDSLKGWRDVLHHHAIAAKQYFDMTQGKNATDMALLIDAMDILYTKNIHTFGLVSSDCDFTPLAHRLREEGKQVIGFGLKTSPKPFVHACTHFVHLDEAEEDKPSQQSKNGSVKKLKKKSKEMQLLRTAVKECATEGDWAPLGPVGAYISQHGKFDRSEYGFSKLSDVFESLDGFEIKKRTKEDKTVVQVRLTK
ncbi:protein containing DUF88 [Rhodopirellula maiorica SM1]|uniref:Protein containing DUF88 n=1 Tax=Rhodopirellula maiorica SM1 TaxID=1265738 RepID=M5RYN4_9BACT|nr:NYN domain-containing protein [Rhodopirellula maiorica]EMI19044.1 protein containing DUF88 [Rhodopirellula maiorica SM1]